MVDNQNPVDHDLENAIRDLGDRCKLLAPKLGVELVTNENVESTWTKANLAKGGDIAESAQQFASTLRNFQPTKKSKGTSAAIGKTTEVVYHMTLLLLRMTSFAAEVTNLLRNRASR